MQLDSIRSETAILRNDLNGFINDSDFDDYRDDFKRRVRRALSLISEIEGLLD
jgi:hypothetical protein